MPDTTHSLPVSTDSRPALRGGFCAKELERLRGDYPLLGRRGRGGQPIAYLDCSATSQKPQCVVDAVDDFYTRSNGAVHRGTHVLADESTDAFEQARHRVATFIGAEDDEVVWTKNATEGLNIVAYAFLNASLDGHDMLGRSDDSEVVLRPGDNIVISRAEHHANIIPWQMIASRLHIELRVIELTDQGLLDVDTLDVIDEHTRIVAFTHVSNVTGAISPVDIIREKARQAGALVVLDTCQSSAHLPIDVKTLDCDFAVMSSHKMGGPTGIGALYGKKDLLRALPPVLGGGDMIADVDMKQSSFQLPPVRFEAGSQPVAQAVGWARALDYLDDIGMERIEAHEHAMTELLLEGLCSIRGVRIIGPKDADGRIAALSFLLDDIHPHDIGQVLDAYDIAVRVGHHCALPLHKFFGVRASTRASATLTTTPHEVERLVDGIEKVQHFFERR